MNFRHLLGCDTINPFQIFKIHPLAIEKYQLVEETIIESMKVIKQGNIILY